MTVYKTDKNNSFNNVFFLTVEGNIGAGKSTFLKKLQNDLSSNVLFEPCDKWQNINGFNALEKFYSDIKRWAYSFQLYAFLTRTESILQQIESINLNKLDKKNFFIAERSIFTDRYVFAKTCYENGYMEDLEWNMYTTWFEWTIARQPQCIIPNGIIYLETTPEKSYQRIMHRGRGEEKKIALSYIEKLYENHSNWLIAKKNIDDRIKEIPVLVLNCNQEFENNSIIWGNMLYSIQRFIESLY